MAQVITVLDITARDGVGEDGGKNRDTSPLNDSHVATESLFLLRAKAKPQCPRIASRRRSIPHLQISLARLSAGTNL
jgi:hypothetical protein